MSGSGAHICRGKSDGRDRLIEADEPLASLQLRIGGELPGLIAIPALLELVRKSRLYGLRLARAIRAQDDVERITAWAEIAPDPDGEGCSISISNWQSDQFRKTETIGEIERRWDIARHLAGLSARLGPKQQILSIECNTPDLMEIAGNMRQGAGQPWTDFVALSGKDHKQPLHWRLLDGSTAMLPGSDRHWTVYLIPLGRPEPGSAGFELHLVAQEPMKEPAPPPTEEDRRETGFTLPLGRELAPVLRQPVARIIANAETIRTQLAGPLAEEYSNYAADIASAGEHLLSLIDDLTDLEVVEREDFQTAPDRIDLTDLARRAAGILSMRAQERGIEVDAPKPDETAPAIGEFRRVLQILLNLLGNAIRYSPENSQIWLRAERDGTVARIIVADQGAGLEEEQRELVFRKFERLGRKGDGGSGLGLYISRRLARAMGGELSVDSAPGQGARFVLELPADIETPD
ncbi:hypothetical protein FHS61_002158 [Altererythrobacter atlanticus]|uniref:histidine kinase n=1 Tax=Croceibacterium atlanticum TaxID=1267766 RepID=A0A0F7KM73_9SPHN|nr:HAMP domain-containing sensor histidine kinase [Croceibacterium atlanticum]AKH41668.1 Non-motile and phage-resistance protein [Croceibacterium atlanticum]MBB5733132.1 hypothetical protein [Croceibacterium atlanticum]